jgi:hypothetical protein
VYVQTKSYSDTNTKELAPTANETQVDPSKGAEDEETARTFKIECHKKELDKFSIDMKQLIASNTLKSKTRSYDGLSEQYVPEVLEQVTSRQDKAPTEETRQPQGQLCITRPRLWPTLENKYALSITQYFYLVSRYQDSGCSGGYG